MIETAIPEIRAMSAELVQKLRVVVDHYNDNGTPSYAADLLSGGCLEAIDEIERLRALLEWQPIETAPPGEEVLLYCPDRGCVTNLERIELGYADNGNGSHHSWATHWRYLPLPPEAADG